VLELTLKRKIVTTIRLFSVASYKGHVQLVKEFLEHGTDIEAKDMHYRDPLHSSGWNGHLVIVNELLSHNKSRGGADIEAKDDEGDMPLRDASWKGHLAVVKTLVSGGANTLAANKQGDLLIHKAMRAGQLASEQVST
jgi:ankyrin repeat protein